jgi:hypothetical protein
MPEVTAKSQPGAYIQLSMNQSFFPVVVIVSNSLQACQAFCRRRRIAAAIPSSSSSVSSSLSCLVLFFVRDVDVVTPDFFVRDRCVASPCTHRMPSPPGLVVSSQRSLSALRNLLYAVFLSSGTLIVVRRSAFDDRSWHDFVTLRGVRIYCTIRSAA